MLLGILLQCASRRVVCHLVMQRVARALGLLAARWGTRLTGCCRTMCILRNPKRLQQDSMLRGVP